MLIIMASTSTGVKDVNAYLAAKQIDKELGSEWSTLDELYNKK